MDEIARSLAAPGMRAGNDRSWTSGAKHAKKGAANMALDAILSSVHGDHVIVGDALLIGEKLVKWMDPASAEAIVMLEGDKGKDRRTGMLSSMNISGGKMAKMGCKGTQCVLYLPEGLPLNRSVT